MLCWQARSETAAPKPPAMSPRSIYARSISSTLFLESMAAMFALVELANPLLWICRCLLALRTLLHRIPHCVQHQLRPNRVHLCLLRSLTGSGFVIRASYAAPDSSGSES